PRRGGSGGCMRGSPRPSAAPSPQGRLRRAAAPPASPRPTRQAPSLVQPPRCPPPSRQASSLPYQNVTIGTFWYAQDPGRQPPLQGGLIPFPAVPDAGRRLLHHLVRCFCQPRLDGER